MFLLALPSSIPTSREHECVSLHIKDVSDNAKRRYDGHVVSFLYHVTDLSCIPPASSK